MGFSAIFTAVRQCAVFVDPHRFPDEFHLLDDARGNGVERQRAAAVRADIESVFVESIDFFRPERRSFAFRMSRLTARLALSRAAFRRSLRLDDIAGRRLG